MERVKQNFELDYWGLSYRKALEHIIDIDKSKSIPIFVANNPGNSNSLMLDKNDRDRLLYLADNEQDKAKYFLSNYRWHPFEYNRGKEIYNIRVGNAKIMIVEKITRNY